MVACNDYILVESCIYRILQRHFSAAPYYAQLLELFHEVRLVSPCRRMHACMQGVGWHALGPARLSAVSCMPSLLANLLEGKATHSRSLHAWAHEMPARPERACAAQTTHQTAHGQLLDIATAPIGTVDLSRYTQPTYMRIVTFKTAFYSFYLPVACGLLVGGVAAPPAFALAKEICIQMGQYFQVPAWRVSRLPQQKQGGSTCQ